MTVDRMQFEPPIPLSRLLECFSDELDYAVNLGAVTPDICTIAIAAKPQDAPAGDADAALFRFALTEMADVDRVAAACRSHRPPILILSDPGRLLLSTGLANDRAIVALSPASLKGKALARLAALSADSTSAQDRSGAARDDLTRAVDAIADSLGASLIVEDQFFQLVGYSRVLEGIDEARRQAILNRQLPSLYQRVFNRQGVLAALRSSDGVIEVKGSPEIGLGPRLTIAVRDAGEFLGSIWLARSDRTFDTADRATLKAFAATLAPIMRRMDSALDDRRCLLRRTTSQIIHGHAPAAALNLCQDLGIPIHGGLHVALFKTRGVPGDSETNAAALNSIQSTLDSVATKSNSRILTAVTDTAVEALFAGCPEPEDTCTAALPRRLITEVLHDAPTKGVQAMAGIGCHRHSLADAHESTDEAMKVLKAMPSGRCAVASMSDVWAEVALSECLASLEEPLSQWAEKLNAAFESDLSSGTEYIPTLLAIMESWGDVKKAARSLHIHPNTLRYRLSRFQRLSGLELSAPDQRLIVHLFVLREMRQQKENLPLNLSTRVRARATAGRRPPCPPVTGANWPSRMRSRRPAATARALRRWERPTAP
jgi:sugar diacid utilization regulator